MLISDQCLCRGAAPCAGCLYGRVSVVWAGFAHVSHVKVAPLHGSCCMPWSLASCPTTDMHGALVHMRDRRGLTPVLDTYQLKQTADLIGLLHLKLPLLALTLLLCASASNCQAALSHSKWPPPPAAAYQLRRRAGAGAPDRMYVSCSWGLGRRGAFAADGSWGAGRTLA